MKLYSFTESNVMVKNLSLIDKVHYNLNILEIKYETR